MGIYSEAIKRPFSNMYKFILGAVLNIVPIVNFFALGYVYEATSLVLKGKKDLPEWKNWGNLFTKGFFIFLITIIWMIPPIFLYYLTLISMNILRKSFLEGILTTKSNYFIAIPLILFILTTYLIPLATINYINSNKFKGAFYLREIFKKAFSLKYLTAWIISMIIMIVYLLIASFVPMANIILVPAAAFAGMITMFTIIAQIYRKL